MRDFWSISHRNAANSRNSAKFARFPRKNRHPCANPLTIYVDSRHQLHRPPFPTARHRPVPAKTQKFAKFPLRKRCPRGTPFGTRPAAAIVRRDPDWRACREFASQCRSPADCTPQRSTDCTNCTARTHSAASRPPRPLTYTAQWRAPNDDLPGIRPACR